LGRARSHGVFKDRQSILSCKFEVAIEISFLYFSHGIFILKKFNYNKQKLN